MKLILFLQVVTFITVCRHTTYDIACMNHCNIITLSLSYNHFHSYYFNSSFIIVTVFIKHCYLILLFINLCKMAFAYKANKALQNVSIRYELQRMSAIVFSCDFLWEVIPLTQVSLIW